MYLRFHFTEEFFDGAEFDNAVVAILVLEKPRELHAAGGVLMATLEQHLAGAKGDGANIRRNLSQGRRLIRYEFLPRAARRGEADPRLFSQFRPGGDLRGIDAGNKRGQRRIAPRQLAQDHRSRRRGGIGEDAKEVLLLLREGLAVFEILDGLFGEKFVETRHHGDACRLRLVGCQRGWRWELFEQLPRVGLRPKELAAFRVSDDAGDLSVYARLFDGGGKGLRFIQQRLQPVGTTGIEVTRFGVNGVAELDELGGEHCQTGVPPVRGCDLNRRDARAAILLEHFQQLLVRFGRCGENQPLVALARPVHVVRSRAPAGLAFDAVLEVDNELGLAEVVGVALVNFRRANVPEWRVGDLGAVLEVLGTEDLDMRVVFGEVADEGELFFPRLLDGDGVGVKLEAVAHDRAVFLEEAGKELFR